jgi:hypothetical protein
MKVRPLAVLLSSLVSVTASLSSVSSARADESNPVVRLAGSVDGARMIPTSSTKELMLDLQLLIPIDAARRLFAGIGPRALTQELLTSTMPEVLSIGLTSSLSAQF